MPDGKEAGKVVDGGNDSYRRGDIIDPGTGLCIWGGSIWPHLVCSSGCDGTGHCPSGYFDVEGNVLVSTGIATTGGNPGADVHDDAQHDQTRRGGDVGGDDGSGEDLLRNDG